MRPRSEGGKSFTVTVSALQNAEGVLWADFLVKEGSPDWPPLTGWMTTGQFGEIVLRLGTPVREQPDAIGFEYVTLIEGEIQSQYHQGKDGQWTVWRSCAHRGPCRDTPQGGHGQ